MQLKSAKRLKVRELSRPQGPGYCRRVGLRDRPPTAEAGHTTVVRKSPEAPHPPWAGRGQDRAPCSSPGRGHSLAKGEVAVEPLRKLGDPGTPRPATPGVP